MSSWWIIFTFAKALYLSLRISIGVKFSYKASLDNLTQGPWTYFSFLWKACKKLKAIVRFLYSFAITKIGSLEGRNELISVGPNTKVLFHYVIIVLILLLSIFKFISKTSHWWATLAFCSSLIFVVNMKLVYIRLAIFAKCFCYNHHKHCTQETSQICAYIKWIRVSRC